MAGTVRKSRCSSVGQLLQTKRAKSSQKHTAGMTLGIPSQQCGASFQRKVHFRQRVLPLTSTTVSCLLKPKALPWQENYTAGCSNVKEPADGSERTESKMSNYEALKKYGFSPAKALEIDLNAKRGDCYAKAFISLALRAAEKEQ